MPRLPLLAVVTLASLAAVPLIAVGGPTSPRSGRAPT